MVMVVLVELWGQVQQIHFNRTWINIEITIFFRMEAFQYNQLASKKLVGFLERSYIQGLSVHPYCWQVAYLAAADGGRSGCWIPMYNVHPWYHNYDTITMMSMCYCEHIWDGWGQRKGRPLERHSFFLFVEHLLCRIWCLVSTVLS